MVREFLLKTLNVPQPLAGWVGDFADTLYAIASSPAGVVVSIAFLLLGYLRLSTVFVMALAALAAVGLVQLHWNNWAIYSDAWRREQLIVFIAASLALCLAANFFGRRLRPEYI